MNMLVVKFPTSFRFLRRSPAIFNRNLFSTVVDNNDTPAQFGTYRIGLMRKIDPSLGNDAIRLGSSDNTEINMDLAYQQHQSLVVAMQSAGLKIYELPSDGLADSVFVEDTVVLVGQTAMITNPGAISRRAETVAIKSFFDSSINSTLNIVKQSEGNLDGGDVLFTGKEFFVGHSLRTNITGIQFLAKTFPQYRVTPVSINLFSTSILHLKSACSMCGPDHLLVGGDLGKIIGDCVEAASPDTYRITHVPDAEAANCVYANGTLIRRTREEFPDSADGLDSIGGKQIEIRASELSKVDAALTCCSVLI